MLRIFHLLIFFFLLSAISLHAAMTITYRAPESDQDRRYDYDTSVLRLSLEKTRSQYGDYKMVPSKIMNYSRTHVVLKHNLHENFFAKLSYEDRLVQQEELAFVPFPIDLGIVGYRVFFISSKISRRLTGIKTVKALRELSIGQGNGWADIPILKAAGFNVIEVPSYESLFKMVAVNRFDLLSRGANELMDEYEAHKMIPGFTYDKTLCLAYPFPRFFFTDKSNTKAATRIAEGLLIAWADGPLRTLWENHYRKSIEFVNFQKRTLLRIPNPYISTLDFDFSQYFIDPFSLSQTR